LGISEDSKGRVTGSNIEEWMGQTRGRAMVVEKGDREIRRMGKFRKQNKDEVNSRRVTEDV
jgi:hypothetical protein